MVAVKESTWGFGVFLLESARRNDLIIGKLKLQGEFLCLTARCLEYVGQIVYEETVETRG